MTDALQFHPPLPRRLAPADDYRFDALTLPAPVTPQPAPVASPRARICYLGRDTAHWQAVRLCFERGNFALSSRPAPPASFASERDAFADLYVIAEECGDSEPHEVCRALRQAGYAGPLLVLAGAGDEISPILALECGADVCLRADGDARTASAQIRALLRRQADAVPPAGRRMRQGETLRIGRCVLCLASRECYIDGDLLQLSGLEFTMLWVLAGHANVPVSRRELLELIWNERNSAPHGRAVDTCISRLRRRLGARRDLRIRTFRSVGYVLAVTELEAA